MDTYSNLKSIDFDNQTMPYTNAELERERQLIASDFLRDACLYPLSYASIPELTLVISLESGKFTLKFTDDKDCSTYFVLSFSPYIRLIREYKDICNAYKYAILHDNPASIETIDMARRGLHNQAAALIQERLLNKITGNNEAFRHLFTLMNFLVNTK